MIIKKFQAFSEKEAIMMAKEEMGSDAVVMNIKTMKQRGFARLFKKDFFEVTAALEEKPAIVESPVSRMEYIIDDAADYSYEKPEEKTSIIEEKLNNLQNILESQMQGNMEDVFKQKNHAKDNANMGFIQLIYSKLLENEVEERYANQIIGEIESSLKKESNIDTILSGIYQKIILKLEQPHTIEVDGNKTKLLFFIGPTGVGKTTTIAKLASNYKLNKKSKIAMITTDTYRIAAVEQLRTYANILDVPLKVVYTLDELNNSIKSFRDYDLIFVDTAGCSHKNVDLCNEMTYFVKNTALDDPGIEKEVYLVVSAATKYNDILTMTKVYKEIDEYYFIFTKLDETACLGNILNVKLNTGASLSYVTSGQVVPDDIGVIDTQMIAKNLLGGGE